MRRVRDPRLILLVSAAMLGAAVAFPLGVIASHQFTDVPTSSTYHADIDAIRDAGITSGCAPGKYCPKDFVTREQMAAFLNRLGALQAGKTPVVNADKVDGRDARDLTYVIDNEKNVNQLIEFGTWGTFEQVTIDAPTAGFVLVTGSVTISNGSCTGNCVVMGALELSTTPTNLIFAQQHVYAAQQELATMTMTRVLPVAAGPNTMQVRLQRYGVSNGTILQFLGQISAIYSPFGETHS